MKRNLIIVILILFSAVAVWGSIDKENNESIKQDITLEQRKRLFRQNIPTIAIDFLGIPYKFGGNPQQSEATDNSHLFFSIYSLAAKKAGLSYKNYLPMKYLLGNLKEVNENDLKNGDLIVLNDDLAAMIYQVEKTGKIHLIYSSEKRQQVLSFTSDHVVFYAYWLENLKGFYRLPDTMLAPDDW
jgi:hypothetical protein